MTWGFIYAPSIGLSFFTAVFLIALVAYSGRSVLGALPFTIFI